MNQTQTITNELLSIVNWTNLKKKIIKNGNLKKEVQTSMNKLFANGNSTYAYAVVLTGCGTIVLVV